MIRKEKLLLLIKRTTLFSMIMITCISTIPITTSNNEMIQQVQESNKLEQSMEIHEREIHLTSRSSQRQDINITISKDMDLSIRCGVSKEVFKAWMKNLKLDTSGFFYQNSDIIYDLCQKYGINEVFFCGLISAESRLGHYKKA